MSPLMQRMLEGKDTRRKRLMALPWPEKVRIVERMRAAAREIQSAEGSALILHESPPPYGGKKKQ